MADKTKIEWTDSSWNPTRGCSLVSAGCTNCYAMKVAGGVAKAAYAGLTRKSGGRTVWTGEVRLVPEMLDQPLRWKRPRRIFVDSMSDLFHPDVPFEYIDRVFAVMALCPQHMFQVLTKRPERMAEWARDPATPFRVARAVDTIVVRREVARLHEECRPIPGFPGYFASNMGEIYTESGSDRCVQCGNAIEEGMARKKFCSSACKALAYYHRQQGRTEPHAHQTRRAMSPDVGEQGHQRVTIYQGGRRTRELVHRLVLLTFDRPPMEGEQACHRDGNPANNALPNLRWGTQSDNWQDRRRHGNAHSYGDHFTVAPPIAWPLPNCWAGTSVEDQAAADERIPHLLRTPAAVRFLSCEPLLGAIDLCHLQPGDPPTEIDALNGTHGVLRPHRGKGPAVHWVIVGGESGPNARPCDVAWIRDIVRQCREAAVPCFVKQLGARPFYEHGGYQQWADMKDHKGGDWDEWPNDLRVREFPA